MRFGKFVIGALCAALILSFCPAVTADAPTEIGSAEDLELLREMPDGDFVLTANIDMTGVDWKPAAFSGTLDGAGYSIYNLTVTELGEEAAVTVDGNDKSYDTALGGFFSALNGAHIKNLSLRGVDMDIATSEDVYVGALAGYASPDTVIENVSVSYTRLHLTQTCSREAADDADRCIAGIGGLVGFGGGSYTNCSTDVTLVFADESTALRCEEFLGGILSNGNASFTNCTVVIDGYAACRGYAHNGGLVGMFYQYDKSVDIGAFSGCSVTGTVTFFEDNTDRRAYCAEYAGEYMSWPTLTDCTSTFTRNEIFDYTANVEPEQCESPSYTDTVIEPDCDSWGHTEHTCSGCGYTYGDTLTPPRHKAGEWTEVKAATEDKEGEDVLTCALCGAEMERRAIAKHVSGEWVTVTAPTYEREGLRQRYCTDCGVLLGEESIPMLIGASGISGLPELLELNYKDTVTLTAELSPEDVSDASVVWTSSDESVVSADASGTVSALSRGAAVLTCTSGDGFASVQIPVTVNYTMVQWIIKILLFGWIWY